MKLLALLGAGVLAAGTIVGAAAPAEAQHYRHGYHHAYGHYRAGGYGYGYRHGGYGYRHEGWRHGQRWHPHRGYYGHRYHR